MNEEQFKKLHNLYRNLPPAQFLDLTIIQCAKVALHFNEKKTVNDIQVWLPALLTFGASLIIAFNVALSTHVHRKLAGSLSFSVAGIALIIFTISTIDTTEIRNEITDLKEHRIDLQKLDIQAMSNFCKS